MTRPPSATTENDPHITSDVPATTYDRVHYITAVHTATQVPAGLTKAAIKIICEVAPL